MVTKRILVFGGSGQIGQALACAPHPEDWDIKMPSRETCDLVSPANLTRIFRETEPDIVINLAEMNDLEACEADPDAAMRLNFEAVAAIAAHCVTTNAPLLHLSTDFVFDGSDEGRPYTPDDAMNPLNAYGKSKLMGEEAVRHGIHWHVILRASQIFGLYGNNGLTQTIHQIETQDEILVPEGQIRGPTPVTSVADALLHIASAIMGGKVNGFGTFHLSGGPSASRADFVRAVMKAYAPNSARTPRLTLILSEDVRHYALETALRPPHIALDCSKIEAIYGIQAPLWQTALQDMMAVYAPRASL